MALNAAEKQRKYRSRRDANPQQRQKWLDYQREKYQKDKVEGKKKLVKGMTAREHKLAKKRWRKDRKERTKRQKDLKQLNTEQSSTSASSTIPPPASLSRQKKASAQKKNRVKSALQRKVVALEKQLDVQRKKIWMYEKRLYRKTQTKRNTPRSKAKNVMQKNNSGKTVRKTLIFHFSLLDQIKRNYRNGRKTIKDVVVADSILRKYGFKTRACSALGLSPYSYREKKGCLSDHLKLSVRDFFLRDDVSRLLTGTNRTVTRKKVKKQKRVLCDTLANLHIKYLAETLENISLTSFWRLKPFWVTYPSPSDRKTCLCKLCENAKYMADCLKQHGVIETDKLNLIIEQTVCSSDKKDCMYRQCKNCKSRVVCGQIADETQQVEYTQWKTVKKERTFKNGDKKMLTITVQETQRGSLGDLWNAFKGILLPYSRHCFNIGNQYNHLRNLRNALQENECIVHIDFSENYVCKLHKEVQAVHFGASQVQISLHTGCYYTAGQEKPVLFSGVSDSLRHDPAAVWAFLRPILDNIKSAHPEINTIHFFSDGPSSQYRSKINFYLLSKQIFLRGFKTASWNYFEASHGKGIPDAVGGTLKRTADRKVLHGCNIKNSLEFVSVVSPCTSIHLYTIDESDILVVDEELLKKTLKTVPGTLKIHQILVIEPENIMCRDVSCTCLLETCSDHGLRHVSFASSGSNCKTDASKRKKKPGDIKPKEESTAKRSKMDEPAVVNRTEKQFEDHLHELQKAKTFEELQSRCRRFDLGENITGVYRTIEQDKLVVDYQTLDIFPTDIPGPLVYPVVVRADGNCLPASGSVHAFGHDGRPNELRVRIVHELALYSEFYLDEQNLKKGLPANIGGSVLKSYAMYSDEYVPGTALVPKQVYEKETLKICRQGSFMGIWQLCALSSVLQMPVFSTYPQLGNPIVRADLHRLVLPRCCTTATANQDPLVIMWTTTRSDMVAKYWLPNHFNPAVSHAFRVQEASASSVPRHVPLRAVPPPEQCVGKWAIVQYDKRLYPGYVLEVDGADLFVDCMHAAAKRKNSFFWPKQRKDVCWYEHGKVLVLISQPVLKGDSTDLFTVDPAVWESVLDM